VAIYSWETRTFNVLLAAAIQVFEMASLFVLFMAFYKKSYKKKDGTTRKKEKEEEQDDQCQVAVATATKTVSMAASAAYNVASKDASKIIETAKKAAPVTVKKNVDGMSRPSWSIIN
jgi:flagellar basal body-associated protein FliL